MIYFVRLFVLIQVCLSAVVLPSTFKSENIESAVAAKSVTLSKRLTPTTAKQNADGTCYLHLMARGEDCKWLLEKFTNVKTNANLNAWNVDNPDWFGCGDIIQDSKVCVSPGNYPGVLKPNADGSCNNIVVKSGDTCGAYVRKHPGLTVAKMDQYNKNTFGWKGCNLLQIGQKVCLTSGTAPKPAVNPDAECGPQAPGDLYNKPCPLNACCSQYGYCGSTAEFCEKTASTTGAPGTAGCISNCGYGSLGTTPANTFKNIMYWLDTDTTALQTDPTKLSSYSHVYYAFVNINADLTIDESKISVSPFLNLKTKKIASFGGWDFSTSPATYQIFRNIVSTTNSRNAFADKLVAFVQKYNLDGIDLDWEYPGAQDMPGIPADYKGNGKKYLELVKVIKAKLPSDKLLTVAIPASYWYLKNFPVKEMQDHVNWFVFMLYDFTFNPYVRCHTDKAAVDDALKLLNKAGVKTWKLMGGIANYGRSFKGCSTENCQYKSLGKMGPDSKTPGFLTEKEINSITSWNNKQKRWTNSAAMCDFMTYNGDSIVAWPKKSQRDSMTAFYKQTGLGGTVTWLSNYSG